jgi:hypothetical protein
MSIAHPTEGECINKALNVKSVRKKFGNITYNKMLPRTEPAGPLLKQPINKSRRLNLRLPGQSSGVTLDSDKVLVSKVPPGTSISSKTVIHSTPKDARIPAGLYVLNLLDYKNTAVLMVKDVHAGQMYLSLSLTMQETKLSYTGINL